MEAGSPPLKNRFIALGAASFLEAAAPAQTSEVGQRAEDQQDRIAQGAKSGRLTAGETPHPEEKDAAINREIRSLNGGKLTAAEKQQVDKQQNQVGKQICADKHHAATQHYGNNEVDAHRENQQDRIANGIASGKLKPAQTAIHCEVHTDRSLNGGKLTGSEKKGINRQRNVASEKIDAAKHK